MLEVSSIYTNEFLPLGDGLSGIEKPEEQGKEQNGDSLIREESGRMGDYYTQTAETTNDDYIQNLFPENQQAQDAESTNLEEKTAETKPQTASTTDELSKEEETEVKNLKKIDQKTRTHEAAHMAAGGGLVSGGATFSYTQGPDGKQYATGGEVHIDISPEKDPDATIRKMQQVRRAALAPADPSSQDRAVAARATQLEAQARSQKSKEQSADSQADMTTETTEAAKKGTNESSFEELLINIYKENENNESPIGTNFDMTSAAGGFASLENLVG